MTKILISTSCRHTLPNQPSGRILVYDLSINKVINTSEIVEPPFRKENPNPRGGLRGSKGISICGNLIALSNASTVFLYDSNWKPISIIYHPSCAGIHDIILEKKSIWITSSRNDSLFRLNFNSEIEEYINTKCMLIENELKPPVYSSSDKFKGELNKKIDYRDPRTHQEELTDTTHINSIAMNSTGELLVSLGQIKNKEHQTLLFIKFLLLKFHIWTFIEFINKLFSRLFDFKNKHSGSLIIQPKSGESRIIKIFKNKNIKKILNIKGAASPSHSVRFLSDGSAIYLKTTSGEIYHFNPESGQVFSVDQIGEYFLRGFVELPDWTVLIGDNNRLIHFDIISRKIISVNIISNDNLEAIFDMVILPEYFGLPPISFIQLHDKYKPVNQRRQNNISELV